jgi:hypothetical protein
MSMFWYTASAVPRYHFSSDTRWLAEGLVAFRTEEVPAALQVPDQAVGLVLGRHRDAADAGIERVRQGEVDDAELAAKIDRRFGPHIGHFQKAASAAAGENIGHGVAGKRSAASCAWVHDAKASR